MATIDPSIPLGIRPVQIESPLNALAQFAQVQNAQQTNALLGMKMQQAQREEADLQSLRTGLSAPGADPYKVLMSTGRVKEAGDYLKSQREADKAKVELVDSKLKQSRAFLDSVQTPEQYIQWHQANHADPILGPELAARGVTQEKALASIQQALQQPGGFQELLKKSALGLEKFTELNKPTTTVVNAGGTSQVLQTPGLGGTPQAVGTVQHTATPGDLLTDARGRQQLAISQGQLGVAQANLGLRRQEIQNAQNAPRGQFIETTNGYVLADPKTGAVRPVVGPEGQPLKGKAADRSLNETQAKANLFGTRMQEADRILTSLEGKYSPMAVNARMAAADVPVVGSAAGYAGNLMLTEQGQQAEQAQRDFVNAVLRRESGAAIAKTEFTNAQRQYFPQPGDSQAVLEQKRRNRALAIQGLEVEVPGGFRRAPTLTSTGQQGGSSTREASGQVTDDPLGLRK
jgi:hypothetical protein